MPRLKSEVACIFGATKKAAETLKFPWKEEGKTGKRNGTKRKRREERRQRKREEWFKFIGKKDESA